MSPDHIADLFVAVTIHEVQVQHEVLLFRHGLECVDEVFEGHVLYDAGFNGDVHFLIHALMARALLAFIDGRVDGNAGGPAREGPFALVELVHVLENADEGFLENVLDVGFVARVATDRSTEQREQGMERLLLCISVSLSATIEPLSFSCFIA